MALRTIPNHLQPPTMLLKSQQQTWHTLDYTLVTPMYGGGVDAHKVDEKMPIRSSAIRGQLRFWWRLLAQQPSWKLGNADDIRRAEFALWGGMDDKDPVASKVLIKVSTVGKAKVEQWATYEGNRLVAKSWAALPYALFPAQGNTQRGKEEDPHELVQAGLQWQLAINFTQGKPHKPERPNFNPNITTDEEDQVWEAIRWWSNFGGVGARTRRGLGAVQLLNISTGVPQTLLNPITVEEAHLAGCQLALGKSKSNAYDVWQLAVNKLKEFRQGQAIGRNGERGRSKWPEADAIRSATGCSLERHKKPVSDAGSIFPRAAFGLPIIFHFTEKKEDKDIKGLQNHEPMDTSLNPVINDDVADRMASPIILRPILVSKNNKGEPQWAAGALLLPHEHLVSLKLQLLDIKNHIPLIKDAKYWIPAQAANIPAIAQNDGGSPLQAFMTYFAK